MGHLIWDIHTIKGLLFVNGLVTGDIDFYLITVNQKQSVVVLYLFAGICLYELLLLLPVILETISCSETRMNSLQEEIKSIIALNLDMCSSSVHEKYRALSQ